MTPVLFVVAAEFGLRKAGKYQPTAFWLPADQPGFVAANPAFGAVYVGDILARMPRPIQISRQKPAGVVRVLVIGESAALGDPEPAFGMPRFLEAILEARFPNRRIEVINAAITALNSHALRRIAADSTGLGADFWVVYPGNNEVHGPFGPANGPAGKVPPLPMVRAGLALRSTAVGQWASRLRDTGGGDPAGGASLKPRWAGLEMFSENRVPLDDARLPAVWDAYRENLKDIVRLGTESGAQVILGTMAVNLPDSPPFASEADGDTNSPSYKEWIATTAKAREYDDQGDWPNAIEQWTKAVELRKGHAETRYHLGVARLNARDMAAGRTDLETARDLDTLRFRADSQIISLTRETAALFAGDKVTLIDPDKNLKGADPARPPGADMFYEHVHLRPEGNYQLALMFADAIGGKLSGANPTNSLTLEECLTRLGWSSQAEARIWNQIRSLSQRPPFSLQSNAESRNRYLDDRINDANNTSRRVGLGGSIQKVESVAALHPDDWQLGEQLARLYHSGRRWSNAVPAWKRVVMAAPNNVMAWHNLGEAFSKTGDREGALAAYAKALDIRPDFVDAAIAVGLIFGDSRQFEAALRSFDQVLRSDPGHMQARVNRGLTLEAMGRHDEAVAELLRAGAEHPESATPHFRLGEALSARKEYAGAVDAFQEAARREPANAALLQRLAGELAKAGHPEQSEALLRKAVQADPSLVPARVDLGVALARQMRFSDAIVEFEAALRLQPGHPTAQTYLERARSMLTMKGAR